MVPVVIVELGQSVNLTCAFEMKYQSNTWLYWFKQSAGDTLNLIVMQQRTTSPMYQPEFNNSRFKITYTDHGSNLTILSIVEQDEGMYHCSQKDTLESTWSGTYLSIKDKRMYSAAIFAMMKIDNTKRKKIAERQMIFVAIKAFGR
uniref:Ig-like domain-containing protein n=1 Tax=Fundulus heteroclitus TaxID=8078 RepID=A0A3Q2PU79_FUNHE